VRLDRREPGARCQETDYADSAAPTPSAEEAARLVNDAFMRGTDWGTFIWTAMTTGARRGELCALHWYHLDLDGAVVHIKRAIGKDENGRWFEKDTKTHQQRRVVLDEETAVLLREHRAHTAAEATKLGVTLDDAGYVFSSAPDHRKFIDPGAATQRYERMAKRLGIDSTLHKLRPTPRLSCSTRASTSGL
jgi:integrase